MPTKKHSLAACFPGDLAGRRCVITDPDLILASEQEWSGHHEEHRPFLVSIMGKKLDELGIVQSLTSQMGYDPTKTFDVRDRFTIVAEHYGTIQPIGLINGSHGVYEPKRKEARVLNVRDSKGFEWEISGASATLL